MVKNCDLGLENTARGRRQNVDLLRPYIYIYIYIWPQQVYILTTDALLEELRVTLWQCKRQ